MDTVSTMRALPTVDMQPVYMVFGRGRLSDFCDDMVIYRNLDPLQEQMPNRKAALRELGLPSERRPRKQEKDYARIAVWFAQQAQKLRGVDQPLSELLFVGDTLYNDGQAYSNMREVSGWRGSCFIGAERLEQAPQAQIDEMQIYNTNRWSALAEWARWTRQELELSLDARSAVIVDIDKTALGAKGRNDRVIDRARIEGAYRTMITLLGNGVDPAEFERSYNELNRARYHILTEDNQDYLAYVCLVLSTGLISLQELDKEVAEGSVDNFDQFTRLVEMRMMLNTTDSEVLRQAHDAVITSVRNGDPTPFKRFRRQEFISTVARMGNVPDDTPLAELLANEITLTEEVCNLVEWLQARGCLLLCFSDKPDEASCPHASHSPDLLPVHRAETHRVGTSIREALAAIG